MPTSYRDDVVLAPGSVLRPDRIDQLNAVLDQAGLGRPLQPPTRAGADPGRGSGLAVLPVVGADPAAVRDALRRASRERGEDLPDLTPDYRYAVHTVELDRQDRPLLTYHADGQRTGHGEIAWLPAPGSAMRCAPPWRHVPNRPVVALLDTPVRDHGWLPEPIDGEPFLLDAVDHGWWPGEAVMDPPQDERGMDYGSHFGHGTFVAGLIRLAAPDAQVLSVPVMDHRGEVAEATMIEALHWLAGYLRRDPRPTVVLMAFGREVDPDDPDLAKVRDALSGLAELTVPAVVASAGNGGSERPNSPAVFAVDPDQPDLTVVSVGARVSTTERAPFSNHGVWVREWENGTNLVSAMPATYTACEDADRAGGERAVSSDGFAWWSGTSFAAATVAGRRAQSQVPDNRLRAPVTGP